MVLVMLKATLTAGEILVLCDQRIEWGRGVDSQQRDHDNKKATGQQASRESLCLTALSVYSAGSHSIKSFHFLC